MASVASRWPAVRGRPRDASASATAAPATERSTAGGVGAGRPGGHGRLDGRLPGQGGGAGVGPLAGPGDPQQRHRLGVGQHRLDQAGKLGGFAAEQGGAHRHHHVAVGEHLALGQPALEGLAPRCPGPTQTDRWTGITRQLSYPIKQYRDDGRHS